MENNNLAKRIKILRTQQGMTQELLAETSGLSLRTIQRIEHNETSPTGDTLKRLSNALNVSPDELIDWAIKEDPKYLTFLNLSALTFIFFPLLGILVPYMLWSAKKGKIKTIDILGKSLINFQLTWTLFLFGIPLLAMLFNRIGFIDQFSIRNIFITVGFLYTINFIMIIFNSLRISNEQSVFYAPQIRFLK